MLRPSRLAALGAAVLALVLVPVNAAYAVAPDTTITSGPADGALVLPGPVQYDFVAVGASDHFECSVDLAPFSTCTSPQVFNLGYGTHVFRVKAFNLAEEDTTPAVRYWVVRNVACEQAGEAYQAAQSEFFLQESKLARAKTRLHRLKQHHASAQKIRKAKHRIKRIKKARNAAQAAMDAAVALEHAVC